MISCPWILRVLVIVPGLFMQIRALAADSVRASITRDTWVSEVGREREGNNGGSPRLKTKGVQEFTLIDIDPVPFKGRVVAAATLHLNCASPRDPQRRLTVSTLSSDWTEGNGTNYRVQNGSACFQWARTGQQPWAFPGSDITAVMCGQGHTIWGFADATPPDKDGWQTVAVDPDVVAARIAGVSHGFVLMDDVGSEYERDGDRFTYHLFPNRYVYSRDQNPRVAPYMSLQLGPEDRDPPAAVGQITSDAADLPAGEAIVTWATPADAGPAGTLGFFARIAEGEKLDWEKAAGVPRYLVPLAGAAGQKVTMHLRDLDFKGGSKLTLALRPVDRAGNVGPISTARIALSDAPAAVALVPAVIRPFDAVAPNPTLGNVEVSIIDALDKVHPVSGQFIPARPADYARANHLWSAATKTIRLYAARNEFVDFQILLSGKTDGLSAQLTLDDPAIRPEILRFRHVNTKLGPLPDPLVPLDGPLSIPAKDETIPGQEHATFLADLYIPHTATPGLHTGTLAFKSGNETLSLRVELHVWNFTLPDHLSFIPEMNCYGLPADTEQSYYRLAHLHRTCLNRLGYNWRGQVNDGCGPQWDGKEFRWDDYDRRFGPLLDGSAFADLPRKGVPVDTFYLPLNENWPIDVNKAFKGGYWADTAFDPAYRAGFSAACGQFAAHINQKNWNQTFFEFYLNNKVYFKDKSWSRSSAPWIFDEPVNTQDFWALRWYGSAFHEGILPYRGAAKLAFRCDISRPQWQRDILDGLLDVNVVGGDFRRYQRLVIGRKQRNGQIVINYGSSNNIEDSNIQPAAWCIDSWCLGADGVLPWQTIGTNKSWAEADPLSLFYPGQGVGRKEPLASIRLKSYRRGQQDVEYLTILAATNRVPHFALANAVREALKLSATVEQKSADDAGLVSYRQLDPAALWSLRLRVGAMLDAAQPPARSQWIELRTPERHPARLSRIGYIAASPK